MRVLLTGGTGMVGRNFLEHSQKKEITILSPTSKELNLFDYSSVEAYLKKQKPDIILHAAGRVGGIQANVLHPVQFLVENLDMGRNIVWAARQVGIKKFINLGSSCMYPRFAQNPLREECILQGELEPTNEGYALAKVTVARLCEYIMRENEEYQYKTLIPCNLFGRWDKFSTESSHLIPAVIRKIHEAKQSGQKQIAIWGDGTARREFMYAVDLADCLVKAIQDFSTLPTLMNVGVGRDYSITEYYEKVAEIIGYDGSFVYDETKPVGMKQKIVNVEKQTQWGWRPSYDLQEGIQETYKFFLEKVCCG